MAGQFKPPTSPTASAYLAAYFDPVSQSDFTESLATNAVGPYWLTFAFLPLLEAWKDQEGELGKKFVPQVIMTSSMNGWTKDPATSGNSFPYLYSKSAIGHATGTLAHELLPLGIRVNGIAPVSFIFAFCVLFSLEMHTDAFYGHRACSLQRYALLTVSYVLKWNCGDLTMKYPTDVRPRRDGRAWHIAQQTYRTLGLGNALCADRWDEQRCGLVGVDAHRELVHQRLVLSIPHSSRLCLGPQWRVLEDVVLTFGFSVWNLDVYVGETVLIDGGVSLAAFVFVSCAQS